MLCWAPAGSLDGPSSGHRNLTLLADACVFRYYNQVEQPEDFCPELMPMKTGRQLSELQAEMNIFTLAKPRSEVVL